MMAESETAADKVVPIPSKAIGSQVDPRKDAVSHRFLQSPPIRITLSLSFVVAITLRIKPWSYPCLHLSEGYIRSN